MLSWLFNFPSKFLKYPGLHYGAPKLKYAPEDQVNKPVILIFGWLGASERHLAKYTKLYQDKGTPAWLLSESFAVRSHSTNHMRYSGL